MYNALQNNSLAALEATRRIYRELEERTAPIRAVFGAMYHDGYGLDRKGYLGEAIMKVWLGKSYWGRKGVG